MINKKTDRNIAIDILKIFALIHMIFDHIFVTLYNNLGNAPLTNFFYNIIPICPALFLFLSGYSLSINEGYKKIKKRVITGLILILTASILFIVEHGLQFPDFIFTAGILGTIGINLILSTLIGQLKHKIEILFLIFASFTSLFISLRLANLDIFPFTTGYEPLLPTLLYGIAGVIFGLLKNESTYFPHIKKCLFIGSSAIFTIISFLYGLFKPLYPDIGRYTIVRTFNAHLHFSNIISSNNAIFYKSYIWNFDILCFIYSLMIALILVIGLEYIVNKMNVRVPEILIIPSKYLVFNYLFHLAVIGILTVTIGFNSFDLLSFYTLLFGIIFSIYAINTLLNVAFTKPKGNTIE